MKYIYIIALFLVCFNVHGQGISFFDGKLEDAMLKAQQENKIIFMDFIAVWCEPCKKMAEEVFFREEVATYFNEKFVCVQIDVDQEKNIAKKYKVTQVPSMIFVDAKGREIRRMLGFTTPYSLLRVAKLVVGDALSLDEQWNAIQKDKNNLVLQQRFLLETPMLLPEVKDKKEVEKYRREKIVKNYLENKPREEMINLHDLSIIVTYCMAPKEENEPIEFVIRNLSRFMTVAPRDLLTAYLFRYQDGLVQKMAMEGNLKYKDQIARIHGDLKQVFDSVKTKSFPVEYLMTAKADALYCLYGKKDQAGYVKQQNDFFEKMGDLAGKEDYQNAVMTLMSTSNKKLTPASAEQVLLWLDRLLKFPLDVNSQILFVSFMGDCYVVLENNEKAKECYNQAFLQSFQMKNVKLQTYLRQKMDVLYQ